MDSPDFPVLFTLLIGFSLGLCIGSFSSALVWRIPKGQSWVYEEPKKGKKKSFVRSKCPSCQRTLSGIELIPVISWLLQGGKCKGCRKPISVIYPILEIMAGIVTMCLFLVMGLSVSTVIAAFFLTFLFLFIGIGLMHSLWSQQLLIILIFLGLLLIVFTGF